MVEKSRRAWGRLADLLRRPEFLLVSVAFTCLAFVTALQAQQTATEASERVAQEAKARAELVEAQNQRDRATFCDVFQVIVAAGDTPPQAGAPPRSVFAQSLLDGSRRVVSTDGFNCTPALNDHN